MVKKNCNDGRLNFTTDLASCINDVDIVFSAVGTPPDEDGSADLSYVLEVARTIGRTMNKYLLVVTKSTVPVGTAALVRKAIQDELDIRNLDIQFDVVYKPFLINNFRIIFMDVPSAEMTKYAANAMLATRISFMNNIANLCEKVGADINMVRAGIGSDERIGSKFLYAGCGYGGSCFPKDVRALIKTASENDVDLEILKAVERVNDEQKMILFKKLSAYYSNKLSGKTIAVWGLSFKPETDDMRDAPSLLLVDALVKAGCVVKAYDPIAIPEAKRRLGEDHIIFVDDMYDALIDADCLMLVTEWKQFRLPSWAVIRKLMKTPYILDGRNIYDREEVKALGFDYECIGR